MGAVLFVLLAALPLVGGTWYVAWRFYFEPRWNGGRWVKTAAALGLTLEPGGSALLYTGPNVTHRMVGTVRGVPVRARIRIEHRRAGAFVYYTYVEAAIARPLDAGLRLVPQHWTDSWMDGGSIDIQVGHPALDAAYRIAAVDRERARRLLTTPYVLEPLLVLSSARFRPYLSDSVVKLEAGGSCVGVNELYGVIQNAVELASRLAAARDALGPSHVERVVGESWRTVAAARGLALDLERRAMSGRTEGVHVEVSAAQRDAGFTTTFLVRFGRPLHIGLRLMRQNGLSSLLTALGMQDIHTGDPNFDARFIVMGRPEAAVRAALTPEVRARLVSLQEHASSLTVEDDHLRADVGWLVSEPEHLNGAIAAIAQAGAALSGVVGEREVGPYRS